jgi:2-amino-4-hydroxy-6-hydroxymethyldihydropteridine diphosphokinase
VDRVFIGAGSNIGDRETHILAAGEEVSRLIANFMRSRIYETMPRYKEDQPPFLNAVFCGDCGLAPMDLLSGLQEIEDRAGRNRAEAGWMGPRPLDLDILLFGGRVIDTPGLQVPHPRITERAFVLIPLLEIWPQARDPKNRSGYTDIIKRLPRQGIYYHTIKPL